VHADLLGALSSKTSSVRALLSLPPNAQRYALLFCLVGTGTLAAGFAYERRVAGEPLRIERDDEGVLRWARRDEALEARLRALEAAGAGGGADAQLLRARLEAERGRLRSVDAGDDDDSDSDDAGDSGDDDADLADPADPAGGRRKITEEDLVLR